MKTLNFSRRNFLEILRDPLSIVFGLGFPIVLLLLLSAIQHNIPVELFEIKKLAPGISVFGLSFITLFTATLISRDRETSFLQRLFTTPMSPFDFICGYMLPLIPLSVLQTVICYAFSVVLGLEISSSILLAVIFSVPTAIFYISLGLLCGSLFSVKQVGGICGALLTNLSAWLSGTWFDLNLVGGVFKKISYFLPFVHAVELQRNAFSGLNSDTVTHFIVVLAYSLFVFLISILGFMKKMKAK